MSTYRERVKFLDSAMNGLAWTVCRDDALAIATEADATEAQLRAELDDANRKLAHKEGAPAGIMAEIPDLLDESASEIEASHKPQADALRLAAKAVRGFWESQRGDIDAICAALAERDALIERLAGALSDMNAGWKYIRRFHGDLYGVGWDRAQEKADDALATYHQQRKEGGE